ncbi:MAG: hypothetical protein EOO89_00030 [Pedobacter sp.]|nr:MAG: hypothetical protein EOO89_00030 [Pedobacter sp.]
MEKKKLIKRLLTKSEADRVMTYERQLARKNSRKIKQIVMLPALWFYNQNRALFTTLGKPLAIHFMVMVHYCDDANTDREIKDRAIKTINLKPATSKVKKQFIVTKYRIIYCDGKRNAVLERMIAGICNSQIILMGTALSSQAIAA